MWSRIAYNEDRIAHVSRGPGSGARVAPAPLPVAQMRAQSLHSAGTDGRSVVPPPRYEQLGCLPTGSRFGAVSLSASSVTGSGSALYPMARAMTVAAWAAASRSAASSRWA